MSARGNRYAHLAGAELADSLRDAADALHHRGSPPHDLMLAAAARIGLLEQQVRQLTGHD